MKKFQRLAKNKEFMHIRLDIKELTTDNKFKDDFQVIWKRGQQENNCKPVSNALSDNRFYFPDGVTSIKMIDTFERVSQFYKNGKGEVQKKTCDFIMKLRNKTTKKKTIDMAQYVGTDKPCEIKFGNGVFLKVIFSITPDDRATGDDEAVAAPQREISGSVMQKAPKKKNEFEMVTPGFAHSSTLLPDQKQQDNFIETKQPLNQPRNIDMSDSDEYEPEYLMTSVPEKDDESDEESEEETSSEEDEPDGLAEFMLAFKAAPSKKDDSKNQLNIRPDYDDISDLLKEVEKHKVTTTSNKRIIANPPKGNEWDITTLDTGLELTKILDDEADGKREINESIEDGNPVKLTTQNMEKAVEAYRNKHLSKSEDDTVILELNESEFCCKDCKSTQGQVQFKAVYYKARFYIIVKGFCHKSKNLIIDFYEFNRPKNELTFIKKIITCTLAKKAGCMSPNLVTMLQEDDYLYYCQITKEDTNTKFSFKKLSLDAPETEDKVYHEVVTPNNTGKSVIGTAFCKRFQQFYGQSAEVGENQFQENNFVIVFYSNLTPKEEAIVEIREMNNFEKVYVSTTIKSDFNGPLHAFKMTKDQTDFNKIPKEMIVLTYKDRNNMENLMIFQVKTDREGSVRIKYRKDVPTIESEQNSLNNEFKDICQFIRVEVKYFLSYRCQWYYEFKLARAGHLDKDFKQVTTRSKPAAMFQSVHALNSNIGDLSLQNCMIVNDSLKQEIIVGSLQEISADNILKIKIVNFDISHDQRNQVLPQDMSQVNKQLALIFNKEKNIHNNLSISDRFHNLVHDDEKVYCFVGSQFKVIFDTNQKLLSPNEAFLQKIDETWYSKFHKMGEDDQIKVTKNMYCELINDNLEIVTQKFIKWPFNEEYEIVWNDEYNCAMKSKKPKPITVSRSRDQSVTNPLQVKFQNLRYQEDDRVQVPFIGSKFKSRGVYDQVWIAMLDNQDISVSECHLLDLCQAEIDVIQSIHLVQSSQITQAEGVKTQNYQVCVWFGQNVWRCKIFEFEITWTEPKEVGKDKKTKKDRVTTTKIIQTGVKELIGSMSSDEDCRVQQMNFFPLFNDKQEIIGSQVLFKLKNFQNDSIFIDLENFQQKDWAYSNLLCKFGYKQYNKQYNGHKNFILIESILREQVLNQHTLFNDYDRAEILFNQSKATMNMVFLSTQGFLQKRDTIDEEKFNFFQPLEVLDGLSLCDYYLNDSVKIQNKISQGIQRENNRESEFYQSNLDQIISSDRDNYRIGLFEKIGFVTLIHPSCTQLQTPLEKCFTLDDIPLQTITTLVNSMFENKFNKFNDNLMRKVVLNVMEKSGRQWDFGKNFLSYFNDSKNIELSFDYDFVDESLPQRSDQDHRIIPFNPEIVSTQSFKAQISDIIKGQPHDGGSEFQLEYSFIDLRIMNWVKKIREYRTKMKKQISKKKKTIEKQLQVKKLNATHISELFETLLDNTEAEVEQWFVVQKFIDFIFFNKAQSYFRWQFFYFLALFVGPILYQNYANDEHITMVCLTICQGFIFVMFCLELFEIRANGILVATSSFWNKNDYCLIGSFTANYYYTYLIGFAVQTEITEIDIMLNVLKTILITSLLVKIMFYLRSFEQFASMISLLGIVIGELVYFTSFYVLLIIGFAILQKINYVQYDGTDYPEVPENMVMILQTFENSIGNIANPSYEKLIASHTTGVAQNLINIQVTIIWLIWFFNQFFILVIVLNFLISVIGHTYREVNDRKVMYSYKYKNDLNMEYLKTSAAWSSRKDKEIDAMILISDENRSAQANAGMSDIQNAVIDSTRSSINQVERRLTKKMDTELSGIKSMLNDVLRYQRRQ